mmetsp:Transcript_28547/g.50728  ORF Transcript_28547/g.50728 Transcript_28547/m.50728 type:complete len:406 (-) Transcript_28547:7-1224(-)
MFHESFGMEEEVPWKPPMPTLYEYPKDQTGSIDFSTLLHKMEASQFDPPREQHHMQWRGKNDTEPIPFNSAATSMVSRMEADIKRRNESKLRVEMFKESFMQSESPTFKNSSEPVSVFSRLSSDSQRRNLSAVRLENYLEAMNTPKVEEKKIDPKTEEQLVDRLSRDAEVRRNYRTAVSAYKQHQVSLEAKELANARHNRKPDPVVRARLESPPPKHEPPVAKPARVLTKEDAIKLGERLMHHRGKSPAELASSTIAKKESKCLTARSSKGSTSRKSLADGEVSRVLQKAKPDREEVISAMRSSPRYNHKRTMSNLVNISPSPSPVPKSARSNTPVSRLQAVIKSELNYPGDFLSIETHLMTPGARTSLDSTKPSVSSVRSLSPLQYLGWKPHIKSFEKLNLRRV